MTKFCKEILKQVQDDTTEKLQSYFVIPDLEPYANMAKEMIRDLLPFQQGKNISRRKEILKQVQDDTFGVADA